MTLRETLRELLSSGPGKAGVALLLLLVVLSIYVLARYPFNFGSTRWSNPAEWADNPKAVPPSWTSFFSRGDHVRHTKVEIPRPTDVVTGTSGQERSYVTAFDFDHSHPPSFFSFSVSGVAFHDRPPVLSAVLVRPDDFEVVLYRQAVTGPRPDEAAPYRRYALEPLRVALTSEASTANALADLFHDKYGSAVSANDLRASLNRAMVGVPDPSAPGGLRLLNGKYQLKLRVIVTDAADTVGSVRFVVGGTVFGIMGTDSLGRDLAQGLAFGLPIALFIGIVASLITTVVGAGLGIISGYMGGVTDMLIQRLADIVSNVPLLPLLIFLVFVFGSHLFLIMLFLVAFSWPGLTILIRSMVLQIRSGQLVEAAVALGASRSRIMYRHVFPHTAPFVLAQLIFFAPAAILAEAGLSFLGLGDPSIPTWGQILEEGFRTGAVFVGYWWWVVPPGMLIIITAVTFMLLSLAMEPVVNPRLRQVR